MPAATTTSLTGTMKQVYVDSGFFEKQLNMNAETFQMIEVAPDKPSALGVFNPVVMSNNEAVLAINETQAFPDPISPDLPKTTILAKLITGNWEVTGSAVRLSEGKDQAFENSLDISMENIMTTMTKELNRMTNGVGTGVLTLVTTGVTSATITVDQITPFRQNMLIDIFASIGGVARVIGAKILAVDPAASTITLNSSITVVAGDVIGHSTVFDGTPIDGKELAGIRLIADNGTFAPSFEGLSVTTYPQWTGNVSSAGGAPISADLLQGMENQRRVVGGVKNSKKAKIVSNYGQYRNFIATETTKVRYEPKKIEAGHTVVNFNNMEWHLDSDYAFGEVGIYDFDYIKRYEVAGGVHISKLDGREMIRVSGFDFVQGNLIYQGNLGSTKRNAHAKKTSLLEPALF